MAFCALALLSGAIVVFGLFANRLFEKWTVLFLRCSLISNIAALLFQLHLLLPAQKVAMASVYCTGIAVLAWVKFRLRGPWKGAFAFATTMVLYFNVLGLSIQVYEHSAVANSVAPVVFQFSQASLVAAFLLLGVVVATRFTVRSAAPRSASRSSMSGAYPHPQGAK
jgi:hypothetical protein